MVGLSVVLEGHHHEKKSVHGGRNISCDGSPKVISKTSVSSLVMAPTNLSPRSSSSSRPPSFLPPAFLEKCFLCSIRLLPGKDIYMYKGDRAFCSVECRCRQMIMDEEETLRKKSCSLAAINPCAPHPLLLPPQHPPSTGELPGTTAPAASLADEISQFSS